ncbi:hypothetical protein LTV02_31785 [Nocardia yamanashiensis]|uniref:hypothetical protein n=1 Tax=Nocardia yamanashiensis TaxID=209247 RepID=UPI001E40562A|nr:hypothetical protein [Nocardia yamanashiensis]UGT40541.1 hypothetical protein LTV02_31785 [Nocardia yamanashiensis]
MSHQLATQAHRSARRTAQVLRYSAIVTAGMASIGLTVAAGSYITNAMAGNQYPGKAITAAPAAQPPRVEPGAPRAAELDTPVASGEHIGLVAFVSHHDPELTVRSDLPIVGSTHTANSPQASGYTGQVRLGDTYVGAQVVPVQRNSVSVTVDTNLFATLADYVLHTPLGEQLGIVTDPSGNTQLRTEVDTRRGEVTLTLSDPGIGRLGVQVARHPAPADVTAV